MLLHESRRDARASCDGEIVLLEEQDRSLWDQTLIAEGAELVTRALTSRRFVPYSLQAAIAAVHAEAKGPTATDCGKSSTLRRTPPGSPLTHRRAQPRRRRRDA